jgi:hypothetical protein
VAGVSTAWLYSQVGLRKRIEDLRSQRVPRSTMPRDESASDQSKDSIISALKLRVRALEDKNRELTRQIEVAYGRLFAVKPELSRAVIPVGWPRAKFVAGLRAGHWVRLAYPIR